jgi:hypothetical protein
VELSVSGQGDPWSSKHYRSILRFVADNSFDLSLNLHSNGLLMTPDRWAKFEGLEKYRPPVNLSIDACRPWTYAVLRRNGDFARLEENLAFIAAKRRAGAFSEFYLNATVQLDNYHETPALALLAKSLGCDGMRFYMLQKTGDHLSPAEFAKKNVAAPEHPLHLAFLETLRSPLFDDPVCRLYDMDLARHAAQSTRLPSDDNPSASPEQCVELVHTALGQGLTTIAAALAAHGRVRYPEALEICLAEASALEALGFREQARYRYREVLRARPFDVNALIGLGTNLIESGDVRGGVRELLSAAATTSEEALLDELAGYLTRLVEAPRRAPAPKRTALPIVR